MAKDDLKSIAESIKALTKSPLETDRKIEKALETIVKIDKRKFNHAGPNSGRKPKMETLLKRGIKAFLDDHVNEKVKVQVTDPKTGKTMIIDKPRVAVVLQQLYALGMGTTDKGSAPALREWLDRALGKAPQPIRGDGDDDTPIKLEVDITKILEKAYQDNDDEI